MSNSTMTEAIHLVVLVAAILGTGLVAGMFYAFSTFIMRGLSELPAVEGMRAMQSINVTVLNRWFMSVFMGTFGLCLALIFIFSVDYRGIRSLLVIAGAVIYVIWCFLVTGTRNVPRNNLLSTTSAESSQANAVWQTYLTEWTYYNHIRTGAALASCLSFICGALLEAAAWT
ncbi:anthrone oxygenase family protein [Alteromonas sp. a30]|uniref:anthrone oxygenase family protein n=1 Tax=Alteromonas sp. a30 TaxID=2730917 RepID=UPI00227EEB3C|nr:anthrone oxygenase family protein [Alteromonas sp. a30]MCY7296488.1 DUF1772 domain-containing protein [Alteromonas sp. a30]